MKKSEKQEQNQGEVEDEGADRKYQVFRRNTFDRHLIEVNMIRGVVKIFRQNGTFLADGQDEISCDRPRCLGEV